MANRSFSQKSYATVFFLFCFLIFKLKFREKRMKKITLEAIFVEKNRNCKDKFNGLLDNYMCYAPIKRTDVP